jgi:flagellar hook-associated protein 1 FlgK
MGLFSSLRMGSDALRAQQTGIETAGHNLANINTAGYTKQRVNMSNVPPLPYGGPASGSGVQVSSITRQVSVYLVNSIRDQGTRLQSLDKQSHIMQQVESIMGELGTSDISTGFSKFFEAAQGFSDNPQDSGFRENYVQEAGNLAFQFNAMGQRLKELQSTINEDVGNVVIEVNQLSARIAELNDAIVRNDAAQPNFPSSTANDLRDQRDEAVRQLAELVNINVSELANGAVNISVTGDTIVAGSKFNAVAVSQSTVDGLVLNTPVFKNNMAPLVMQGGELHGLVRARDTLIGGVLTDLDALANGFMKEVNKIQTTGFGLQGYSEVKSFEKAGGDTSLALNAAGFSHPVANGGFNIEVRNSAGVVTPIYIQVDADGIGADSSVESLKTQINNKLTAAGFSDLSASVDSNGFFSLKSSSPATTFSFSDDTSNVLHTLGWGTLFNGEGADGMQVNSLVAGNLDFLAAGLSTAVADNTNIARVVSMRSSKVLNAESDTIEEFYRGIVSNTGANTARLASDAGNQGSVVASLQSERLQVSGVNTDEELVNLMTYQRAYQGSARFLSVVDDLLDTLINGIF